MSNAKKETEMSKSDQEENETVVVSASSTSNQGGCTRCCRETLTFLASTLGLTVLTVAYSALGGYIFMVLESPTSPATLDQSPTGTVSEAVVAAAEPGLSLDQGAVRESLAHHLERLWNATEHLNVIYKESWAKLAEELLQRYADDVFEAVRVNGTVCAALEGTNTLAEGGCPQKHVESNQWSYPGSLLYAITVVTTIGYGHITPKSLWGRIVTMVYAVFGIPLTFLTIAHLGRIMATAFRFVYRDVCCIVCRASRRRRRRSATRRADGETGGGTTREATPCVVEKGESKQETEVAFVVDEGGGGGGEGKQGIADVKVPISVTVVVLVGYIGLGSLLFSIWERWSIVEASYFCFITLSTIGFGDFVPGMSLEGAEGGAGGSHAKLLCCALYLLLGLSFLAMCFDLIQEEVVNKFRRIGKCIGLVKESK